LIEGTVTIEVLSSRKRTEKVERIVLKGQGKDNEFRDGSV
jgi:hypothetical protein